MLRVGGAARCAPCVFFIARKIRTIVHLRVDSQPQPDALLVGNTAGEPCPRPLLDTQPAAAQALGQRIAVWATDPHFGIDLQASALAERFADIRIKRQPGSDEK